MSAVCCPVVSCERSVFLSPATRKSVTESNCSANITLITSFMLHSLPLIIPSWAFIKCLRLAVIAVWICHHKMIASTWILVVVSTAKLVWFTSLRNRPCPRDMAVVPFSLVNAVVRASRWPTWWNRRRLQEMLRISRILQAQNEDVFGIREPNHFHGF